MVASSHKPWSHMRSNLVITILFIISLLVACDTETVDKPLIGPNYLPVEVGKYINYACTEIKHDAFLEKSDTFYFWIKESCVEESQDSNFISYKCIQEHSNDSGKSWVFEKWVIYHINDFNILRQEDDVLKSKLIIPLVERITWDANSYSTLPFQRAWALDLGNEYQSENITFTNTTRIDLGNSEDVFFTNYEEEIYAEGIGLIISRFQDLERQPEKYIKGNEYVKIFQESNW